MGGLEWQTPWEFFVAHWWYGLIFHLALHPIFWITKAGHWSSLWGSTRG